MTNQLASILVKTSSFNPAGNFIILFNRVNHKLNATGVDRVFKELAVKFHVTNIVLLYAVTGTRYEIFNSEVFVTDSTTAECGTYTYRT